MLLRRSLIAHSKIHRIRPGGQTPTSEQSRETSPRALTNRVERAVRVSRLDVRPSLAATSFAKRCAMVGPHLLRHIYRRFALAPHRVSSPRPPLWKGTRSLVACRSGPRRVLMRHVALARRGFGSPPPPSRRCVIVRRADGRSNPPQLSRFRTRASATALRAHAPASLDRPQGTTDREPRPATATTPHVARRPAVALQWRPHGIRRNCRACVAVPQRPATRNQRPNPPAPESTAPRAMFRRPCRMHPTNR